MNRDRGKERANEQMLTELTALLHDNYDFMNALVIKNEVSTVLKKYQVTRLISDENTLDLEEKISMFISAKQIEGLSPNTLEGYAIELNLFARAVKKHTRDIYATDIRSYLSGLQGIAKSTLGKKLHILRSFFSWLTGEEIIPTDPTTKVKLPKQERKLPIYLTIEELEFLRECCKTRRQRALTEIFYSTGCRLSELWALNRSDIDLQNQSAVVFGKGSKERVVYFSAKALYHLNKYLESRMDEEDALFITERRPYRRMSRSAIQRKFRLLAEKAGLEEKLTCHAMRRTFASLTLQNGAEISAIQSLLGHSSPSTTMRYSHMTEDKKREQHKKFLVQ